MRHINRILVVLALGSVFAAGQALAGTGKIKVTIKDKNGVALNGKVTATKGSATKTCTTAAGKCTISGVAAGAWKVTAKSTGGKVGGPSTANVKSGKVASLALVLKDPPKVGGTLNGGSGSKGNVGGDTPAPSTSVGSNAPKNLASGQKKKASGHTKDKNGIPLNGVVTVIKDGKVVGESKTAAGSYRVYDLPAGSYKFKFTSHGGKTQTKTVSIKSNSSIVINFSVQ